MRNYDYKAFVTRLIALASPRDMTREVTSASQQAQAAARAYRNLQRHRAEQAKDFDRFLGGVGFFLYHGAKADGISQHEFSLLLPLAEALVQRGQWRPEALNVFLGPSRRQED